MKEADIMRAIQIAASAEGYRLFRQNVGMGWTGEVIQRTPTTLTLQSPRPLRAGLCEGSGDLIGWIPGPVGVFCSVEVKTKTGRVSAAQQNFLEQVRLAGGIAIVARSPEDAMEQIKSALAKLRD